MADLLFVLIGMSLVLALGAWIDERFLKERIK